MVVDFAVHELAALARRSLQVGRTGAALAGQVVALHAQALPSAPAAATTSPVAYVEAVLKACATTRRWYGSAAYLSSLAFSAGEVDLQPAAYVDAKSASPVPLPVTAAVVSFHAPTPLPELVSSPFLLACARHLTASRHR